MLLYVNDCAASSELSLKEDSKLHKPLPFHPQTLTLTLSCLKYICQVKRGQGWDST